jgi:hypothetical protein
MAGSPTSDQAGHNIKISLKCLPTSPVKPSLVATIVVVIAIDP